MRISDWSSDVCSSDLNKLDYILGAFYLKFEPDGKRGNMQNQFNSIFATSSYVEIETKAIFAQIGYDLSSLLEGLKLNIGGRYTWTKQEACGTTNYAVTNLDDFNTREQCYANASAGGLGRAILKSKEDRRTEERGEGKEWVSRCRTGWSP